MVMGRDIDVYQLVKSFALRNDLIEFEYKVFAQAIQRQARLSDQSEPIYRDLALNPDIVLVPRLFLLSKDKKIFLQADGNEIRSIILPDRFAEAFFQEYRRMDENPDVPFPDEDTLKIPVPGEWIQSIAVVTDLGALTEPTTAGPTERPVPLYRITFPDGVRPLVVPSAFVPDKLLEYSILKLRQYLRKGANKDYMYNKLVNAFSGKESQLKDALGGVLAKHLEAVKGIVSSDSDFTYPFWAYFVSAVKKDLDKKKDKTPEDWSCYQSAILVEFYVNHYKGKAQRIQDLEATIKSIDLCIRKPPYHFTFDEILGFRDARGVPVLNKFSKEELESRIKEKSTKAEDGALPELLLVSTSGRRAYIAKSKVLLLAVRLISEARSEIRSKMIDQWKRLLEDFRTSPAMEDDGAFLAELVSQVESRFPLLEALIRDRLLPLVRDEASSRGELPPDVDRLFYNDNLVPLDELLLLARKPLLVDAKMLLPFWYSVPVITTFARLMHRLSKGRDKKAAARAQAEKAAREEVRTKKAPEGQRGSTPKERRAKIEAAATKVAKELLPRGYGLDDYLRELEERWNTLISPEAKRNLTYDVGSLARDYLRGVMRSMGGSSFTTERVKNLGSSLADSPTLLKIKNHQALELYLQLYMVKILGARIEKN
jgi:hypothetical protein